MPISSKSLRLLELLRRAAGVGVGLSDLFPEGLGDEEAVVAYSRIANKQR